MAPSLSAAGPHCKQSHSRSQESVTSQYHETPSARSRTSVEQQYYFPRLEPRALDRASSRSVAPRHGTITSRLLGTPLILPAPRRGTQPYQEPRSLRPTSSRSELLNYQHLMCDAACKYTGRASRAVPRPGETESPRHFKRLQALVGRKRAETLMPTCIYSIPHPKQEASPPPFPSQQPAAPRHNPPHQD